MSNAYKDAPLSGDELNILRAMSIAGRFYRATNMTSARLTSLERRGYAERVAGRTPSARPTWILTHKGKKVNQ